MNRNPSKSRAFCFTLNNYTDAEQENLRALGVHDGTRFLIFGRERGESGTPHLQGYVLFNSATSAAAAKRRLGPRYHVETARGRPDQNIKYCSKEGDTEEFGQRPEPGRRSDLADARDAVQRGRSLKEAMSEGSVRGFQALRFYSQLERIYNNKPRQRPELHLVYGESGAGKSFWCKQQLLELAGDDETPWTEPAQAPYWWEGVDQCSRVLLDDFRVEKREHFTLLLRMFDDFNIVQCPVKGGFVRWSPTVVYITCPDVASLVPQGESTWQLVRRCTRILEATNRRGDHVVTDKTEQVKDMFRPR